jgi:hypothetical protein
MKSLTSPFVDSIPNDYHVVNFQLSGFPEIDDVYIDVSP